MTNHSQYCIKEPNDNCVNCCPNCSNCEEKESEDEMSDTPRTDSEIARIKEATKSMDNDSACFENYQCMRDFARELERDLAAMTAERDALKQVEQSACDMARAMIGECSSACYGDPCADCEHLSNETCPARVYLAAHKQTDAWEVK